MFWPILPYDKKQLWNLTKLYVLPCSFMVLTCHYLALEILNKMKTKKHGREDWTKPIHQKQIALIPNVIYGGSTYTFKRSMSTFHSMSLLYSSDEEFCLTRSTYMTNVTIVSLVKMEYGWNFSISGLKMLVESGLEKIFLKFLHVLAIF